MTKYTSVLNVVRILSPRRGRPGFAVWRCCYRYRIYLEMCGYYSRGQLTKGGPRVYWLSEVLQPTSLIKYKLQTHHTKLRTWTCLLKSP